MSASLVGSEMCIRDSDRALIVWVRLAVCHSCRSSSLRSQHATQRLRRVPVSYTHLTLPTICSV
eukprot:4545357-Alexandrium_andersonii.AAC.1